MLVQSPNTPPRLSGLQLRNCNGVASICARSDFSTQGVWVTGSVIQGGRLPSFLQGSLPQAVVPNLLSPFQPQFYRGDGLKGCKPPFLNHFMHLQLFFPL